jgi:hypothetical protein
MNAQKIEPITLLCTRLKELDLAVSESPEEPLITDIAHTIQSELRATLLKEYRLDRNFVRLGHASIVIHKSSNLKQVQSGIMFLTLSSRIIMITMNGKHRNRNIDILILIIDMVKWSVILSAKHQTRYLTSAKLTAQNPQ